MGKHKPLTPPPEIYFSDEPRGIAYAHLVDFAQGQCATFSLVWRGEFKDKRLDREIAKELSHFLLSERLTNQWPGTTSNHAARVCTYGLNAQTIRIIMRASGLYGWRHPELPEDIALYNKGGAVWLGSVAHERIGWLNTAAVEASTLNDICAFLFANGAINRQYVTT